MKGLTMVPFGTSHWFIDILYLWAVISFPLWKLQFLSPSLGWTSLMLLSTTPVFRIENFKEKKEICKLWGFNFLPFQHLIIINCAAGTAAMFVSSANRKWGRKKEVKTFIWHPLPLVRLYVKKSVSSISISVAVLRLFYCNIAVCWAVTIYVTGFNCL